MRLLPDDHYAIWPVFASRIAWAYNTASHSSIGGISPYEVYHGVPARDFMTSGIHQRALDDELDDVDLTDPTEFALAVKTSVVAFIRLAKAHSDLARMITSTRLNLTGFPKTYVIGDLVKIRVPPTHEQILVTGRRSSHISAWRGPCIVTGRLSETSYSMDEQSTGRSFERVISNILPCFSYSQRTPVDYVPSYSDPFQIDKFIAVRDEPNSPFYIALVTEVTDVDISLHYYGSTTRDIRIAKFRPCWHVDNSNEIFLTKHAAPPNMTKYTGIIQFDSVENLLVARRLEMLSCRKLRRKSQQLLYHILDELFFFRQIVFSPPP
jgi:hypothetical protein